MTVSKPVLCITVVLLLGVVHSKRKCNYSMILTTYRTLTFVELQSLNLTGPFDTAKEKDGCPSKKVHRILHSIYGMTQLFACLSEGHYRDSKTNIVASMGQLIRQNCKKAPMGKRQKATSCKNGRKQKKIRHRRLKIIEMLVKCWQKLQSMYN